VAIIEANLNQTTKKIHSYEESMHVLSAEWNFLNNPVRLQQLAEQHLGLVPGNTYHVVRLKEKATPAPKGSYDTDAMMRLASQLGD
jgi:hypothetical protein